MADWPPHLVRILEVLTCSASGVRVLLVIAKWFSTMTARIVVDFTFAASQSLNAAPMNLEEWEELFTIAFPSLLTPYQLPTATSYPRSESTLWCIAVKKREGKVIGILLNKISLSCPSILQTVFRKIVRIVQRFIIRADSGVGRSRGGRGHPLFLWNFVVFFYRTPR